MNIEGVSLREGFWTWAPPPPKASLLLPPPRGNVSNEKAMECKYILGHFIFFFFFWSFGGSSSRRQRPACRMEAEHWGAPERVIDREIAGGGFLFWCIRGAWMRGNYSEVYEPASANKRILGPIVWFTIIVRAPGGVSHRLDLLPCYWLEGHSGVNRFYGGWGGLAFQHCLRDKSLNWFARWSSSVQEVAIAAMLRKEKDSM